MEQEREAVRRQIIEEERRRLLKHHATKLLGYFPKVRGASLVHEPPCVLSLTPKGRIDDLVGTFRRACFGRTTWNTLTRNSGATSRNDDRIFPLEKTGRATMNDLVLYQNPKFRTTLYDEMTRELINLNRSYYNPNPIFLRL